MRALPMRLIFLLAATLLSSTVAATADAALDGIAQRLLTDHLRPIHARFSDSAASLESAAGTFCAAPSEGGLKKLRAAFGDAMEGWQGVQHIAFGPIQQFNQRFRIQFWPDSRNTIGRQLADIFSNKPEKILKPFGFTFASVAVQGLPVIERLIYGDDARKLLAKDEDAAYRCRFLAAVAANVAAIAKQLAAGWADGSEAVTALRETPKETVASLLTGIDGQILAMRDRKLIAPLGKSAKASRPHRAESWRSELSMRNLVKNLRALQALFADVFRPDLVKADRKLADLVALGFSATLETAQSIRVPLARAVEDPAQRPAVEKLAEQLRSLRQVAGAGVAQALGLSLGFNSQDGD